MVSPRPGCVPVAKSVTRAGSMGIVVFIGLSLEETYSLIGINIVAVLTLVGLGAAVYFVTLFVISSRFQTTVKDNLLY